MSIDGWVLTDRNDVSKDRMGDALRAMPSSDRHKTVNFDGDTS